MTARRRARGSRRGEDGAATLFAVSCLAVLLVLGAALGVVAAVVVAHRQAQAAADLSALAGAQVLGRGRDPCAAADEVAAANGARLASCVVAGREVLVEVTAPGPRWLGQDTDPSAQARAGPAQVTTTQHRLPTSATGADP
ncbi:Rv3654c family TadE-like protein [Nocardioides sp. 503]|uniref:Rv3654c family TadE-like protein n=1 Tax=Nocardioides sp. 503 TaxID=2508326 RepID=UPI00106FF152|nr:Rv3654c family TadE-like protein [Nocardioides sp. 503]